MSKHSSKDQPKAHAEPSKPAASGAKTELQARDRILELLSDTEMAKVSTAESAVRLQAGEEYLDLEQLDQGVRHADDASTPMGRVLPRRAVREQTWTAILAQLPSELSPTP